MFAKPRSAASSRRNEGVTSRRYSGSSFVTCPAIDAMRRPTAIWKRYIHAPLHGIDGYEAGVAANDVGAIELIPRFQRERNTPSLIGACREYP
ncbi:hypothetical protein PCAR4_20058 [Paraburkholderia caribensis]|nr:hypothetical protein PCAR4_20058 [Paraburkholderia caribensis]